MNIFGDVPESDKKLAIKLTEYEKEVDEEKEFPNEKRAQSYVCLAHDWYQMGMDEEGSRLLLKAEDTYPGYFKTKIDKHAKENPDFALIVRNLRVELMWMVVNQVKDK